MSKKDFFDFNDGKDIVDTMMFLNEPFYLFLDFDGTLCLHGDKEGTARNIAAIKNWQKAGNKFGIVTGRSLEDAKEGLEECGLEPDFCVIANGGEFFKSGNLHFTLPLLPEVVQEIEWTLQQLVSNDEASLKYHKGPHGEITQIDLLARDYEMLMFYHEIFESLFGGHVKMYPEGDLIFRTEFMKEHNLNAFMSIVSGTAGKENGLALLSELYTIPFDNIFVAGDGINDCGLLQNFASFAIGNRYDVINAAMAAIDSVSEMIEYLLMELERVRMGFLESSARTWAN